MEPSVSSSKQSVLSPPDCMSDQEEHEISEEDDDDRNHKHRRKEIRSQSSEQEPSDQAFTRPYRKNYRHFENGNMVTEREKRPLGAASAQRFDSNQRMRSNPMFSRDYGPDRGRGNYGAWTNRDSRFNPIDLSSHMAQVGSIAPGMFGGREIGAVSAAQIAPWSAFGLLPGVPNGGLDGFHHLPGPLRPPLNAPLNMGIPRQRCRDFEERGFCLRGDMCPMEHGINRIVVDDVQSLSQFNLPVSLPGAPHLPASSKPVPAQFGSGNSMNTKEANGKTNEGGMAVDVLEYGDAYPVGTDFYDPDQPLWNNSAGETSGALSHGIDETVAPSDDNNQAGGENVCVIRDSRSTSQPVWGRMRGSNSQANTKEKADAVLNSSAGLGDQLTEVSLSCHGKQNLACETVTKVVDSSNDAMNNTRKPTQKATRTLFVNGIPLENNKKDLILAHFQKFGKVIDIRILSNTERAFVQFSKREEAESALRAPDAVMGNRFIKLWWANRDSVPDNGLATGNGVSMKGRGMPVFGGSYQLPVVSASKNKYVSPNAKGSVLHTGEAPSSSEHPKPVVITNGPKFLLPQQKKSEALGQLKEELRKKQEMLEQKRNEFRKKLAKLQKHGTVVKGETADEPDAKRLKVDAVSDSAAAVASPKMESPQEKKVIIKKSVITTTKQSTEMPSLESKIMKHRPYPFTKSMSTPMANRYRLDNRTTTLKVVPPLPTGLADVAVLKEHFSSCGEVTKVELEDAISNDSNKDQDTSMENHGACVTFLKRSAAEKAFTNAKSWQQHVLQFVWVTRQTSGENNSNPSVSSDPSGKTKCTTVSNDPKPAESSSAATVKASSLDDQPREEPENNTQPQHTNISEHNTSEQEETKESDSDNDYNECNSESIKLEGASEAAGNGEEQSESQPSVMEGIESTDE